MTTLLTDPSHLESKADINQMVFSLYCIFVLLGEKYGTGRHWYELSPGDFQTAMMVRYQLVDSRTIYNSNTL
jgi:hypothetical protein